MSLESRLHRLEAQQGAPHPCPHRAAWLRTLTEAERTEYEALRAQGPADHLAARPPRFWDYALRWHTWHQQIAPGCPVALRTQALLNTARRRRQAATGGGP